jgi:BA14K-like protein
LIGAVNRRRNRIALEPQLYRSTSHNNDAIDKEKGMTFRAAIVAAIVATVFAGTAVSAAPMAPLTGVGALPIETVQFRGGNWRDHPLMYRGNWEWHQRQWDAIEGRGVNAGSTRCARFRSYDRASHTYVNRNGRRVPCP